MTTAAEPAATPTNEWKNLLGVCGCLAEDFGFNPLWLRIALGISIIFAPWWTVGTYLALGLVVLSSRLIFPNRKPSPAEQRASQEMPRDVPLPLAA